MFGHPEEGQWPGEILLIIMVLKDFRQMERNKGGIANRKLPHAGREGQCLCISKKYIQWHM